MKLYEHEVSALSLVDGTVSFMSDLTPEDEARIVDQIADQVVKRELETAAIMFLESIKPVSYIGSQLAMIFVAPFLSIFGDMGINYIKFFDRRENVDRLLKRIEEEVAIRDGENKTAKEQKKLISDTFGFGLELLRGYSLQENPIYEMGSGHIGITRKETAGGGFLMIAFSAADSSTTDLMSEVAKSLDREDVRHALMLSQDMAFNKLDVKQMSRKIKGHNVSMNAYEWNDNGGRRGLIRFYGLWCHKTKRRFVMGMRTGPLTGQRDEKNQLENLEFVLGSLKCH